MIEGIPISCPHLPHEGEEKNGEMGFQGEAG
jgi:hypothetical protein